MNQEAQTIVNKMVELFKEQLADPEVFPKMFEYQVKLAKFQLQIEARNNNGN
jgi:hypothetical protein